MINPEGVRHQIHGNVIQSTSRVLKEKVTFSDIAVTSRDWGTYPLLTFPELPAIDVLMVPRPDDEPLGVGESASVPSAAAIANAIFDATGVRFREPPFTPDRILEGLREAGLAEEAPRGRSLFRCSASQRPPKPRRLARPAARGGVRSARRRLASRACRSAARSRRSRGPIPRPGPPRPSSAAGRLPVSAAAFICHTAQGGEALAGGRAIAHALRRDLRDQHHARRSDGHRDAGPTRPSSARCARESRRDGRHLFPAFPYTVLRQGERGRPAGALCLSSWLSRAVSAAEPAGEPSRALRLPSADGGVEHDVPSSEALRGAARSRR